MNNVINFPIKNNVLEKEPVELSKEDYEFYEDLILNTDLAQQNEVAFECEDGFCITYNGEVKLSPMKKDFYNYLKARNNQKKTIPKKHLTLIK